MDKIALKKVDPTLLLTKTELARHFRICERQVDNLKGQLPEPIRLGSVPRWSRQGIADWIAKQSSDASEAERKELSA